MRPGPVITLPIAPTNYDVSNEQTTRRTIEQGMQALNSDIVDNREKTGKESSLAVRRFQFLLMGAPGG